MAGSAHDLQVGSAVVSHVFQGQYVIHLGVITQGFVADGALTTLGGAQLVSLVHTHRLSLATVAVLLFFLLVMNLALVVGMRWLHADRRWSAQYAGYGAVMASD